MNIVWKRNTKAVYLLLCLGLSLGALGFLGCSDGPKPNTCQQDSECPSGQRCEASVCKSIDPTCRADTDCTDGKLCIKSKCQFVVCQDNRDCNTNETCEGGYCKAKADEPGQEVTTQEPSNTETANSTEPSGNDGGTTESPVTKEDSTGPESVTCMPNRDGTLERSELLFKVGTSVIYSEAGSSSNPVTVDLKGTPDKDGVTVWDFSGDYPGASRVVDELLDPKGNWFSEKYPDATYISMLDRTLSLFGIFQVKDDALLLMGSASKSSGFTKTQTTYDTPVPLFKFPMSKGTKWAAKATSSGTLTGAIYRATEEYEFEVDAVGKLKTKVATFDVVRLRVSFTQQQTLPTLYRRTRYSYYFLSECYGIVGTVDSKDYESNTQFTEAARVKIISQ